MRVKQLENAIAVRLDIGDEISESLKSVCSKYNITTGIVSGIGTTDNAVIGIYNLPEQKFEGTTVTEFCEISDLSGNISTMDDEVYLHLHATLGSKSGKVFAGHLQSAVVAATAEIFIIPFTGIINRRKDNITGLNIFDF